MRVHGPLRVAIVDDEAPARRRLRELLEDCAAQLPLEIVGEADNGRAGVDLLGRCPADVALLDVRMPGMDGIEVARHLGRLPQPPAVIFVTAFDAYAIQAFEVHAVDYLLKPVRLARLKEALQRTHPAKPEILREIAPAPNGYLSIQEKGRVRLIAIEEVIYLKAELKYITVRTREREYLLEDSLAALEQEYGSRFLRVHRNCLVARDWIRGFEKQAGPGNESLAQKQWPLKGHQNRSPDWVVVLKEVEERLPVSRRQQHLIRNTDWLDPV